MKAHELKNLNSEFVQFIAGNLDAESYTALPPEKAQKNSLVFIAKPEQFNAVKNQGASIIIAAFDAKNLAASLDSHQALFQAAQLNLGMTVVLPFFDTRLQRFDWGVEIHPKAFVDPTAQLGEKVKVGPGAFIGAKVRIGAGSIIGANSVIEKNCVLGKSCLIHPLAFIGAETEMGDRCEIHPQVTIGGDGFGFAFDKSKNTRKIPQIGRVILGDDVEVGANTTIDRATMTETRIHSGTKFDKHCHVAHNCEIGRNSVIAGGFFVAGSSKIGSNFMSGGTAVVTDHVNITDNVMLAGRGVITKDVEKPGAYGGYPLEPLRESLKTIANFPHITKMRKQLSAIMTKLGLEDE